MTTKKIAKAKPETKAPQEAKCECGETMLDAGKGIGLYCPKGFKCPTFRKGFKASVAETQEAKAEFLETLQNQGETIAERDAEIAKLKAELDELRTRSVPAGWEIISAETPRMVGSPPPEVRGGIHHNILLSAFSWWFRDSDGRYTNSESDTFADAVMQVTKRMKKASESKPKTAEKPSKKGGKS
jgi:hypothetical protein